MKICHFNKDIAFKVTVGKASDTQLLPYPIALSISSPLSFKPDDGLSFG
jgi:hypothetical protein